MARKAKITHLPSSTIIDDNFVLNMRNGSSEGHTFNGMFFDGSRETMIAYQCDGAGQRGKKITVARVRFPVCYNREYDFTDVTCNFIREAMRTSLTAEDVIENVKIAITDFKERYGQRALDMGYGFSCSLTVERGIDLRDPFDDILELTTDEFYLEVSKTDFRVRDFTDKYNEPYFTHATKASKIKEATKFYNAIQAKGLENLKTLSDVRMLMINAGVRYTIFFRD
jgi:hypothetical protein